MGIGGWGLTDGEVCLCNGARPLHISIGVLVHDARPLCKYICDRTDMGVKFWMCDKTKCAAPAARTELNVRLCSKLMLPMRSWTFGCVIRASALRFLLERS